MKSRLLRCAAMAALPALMLSGAALGADVPRSGSVDVPLAMAGIPPLPPLALRAANGPRQSALERSGTFGGKVVRYRAEMSEVLLSDASDAPVGNLFTTSYVVAAPKGANRPVLFLYNGGPGGSSSLLNLTGLGPKRLSGLLAEDLANPANPLVDNADSILDAVDLVFVDPVDTGFGRAAPGRAAATRSVDGDADANSAVVLNWLRAHGRMGSPVYLLGESYGTLRVVAMARDLARSEARLNVAGVVLAGSAYTFGSNGRTPNPMFVAAKLPMMASVAWHYGKIDNKGQTWEQAVDRARAFVRDSYAGALMQGHRLDAATRDRVIAQLPSLIGIPESYFRSHDTIAVTNFNAELLRSEGRVLDSNDGLQSHPAPTVAQKGESEAVTFLKGYVAVASTMERIARNEFGLQGLGDYRVLDPASFEAGYWNMQIAGDPALDVTLAKLLNASPATRLLVLQGRYDTLTDLGSVEYVLGQTNIAPSRYTIAHFDGGHAVRAKPEVTAALRAMVAAPR